MKKRRSLNALNNQAFTLLELLIAMVILALLTGLGIQSFGSIQQRSRDSRRKQDLANIAKSLEIYYNDFGQYPVSTGKIAGCGSDSIPAACDWGEAWQKTIENSGENILYMVEMPIDPVDGFSYYYDGDGSIYSIFAQLENEEDLEIARDGETVTVYQYALCSEPASVPNCNYVISSTNKATTPAIVPAID